MFRVFARAVQRLRPAVAPPAAPLPPADPSLLLERAQDLDGAVLEATGALLLVCDPEGRTVRVNPALQRFTGLSAEELMGRPFWEIVVLPEEVQLARVAVADVLQGGKQVPAEVDWVAARGERRRVELQTSRLVDESGLPYAVAFLGFDVTVHREREARYEHQAMHDDLTGVANRGALFDLLGRCLDAAAGTGCGLLFCDLDDFKSVNDTRGHAVGDRVLVAVAERLRDIAGDEGVAGRMGGDEFVVLFPGMDPGRLDEKAHELELRMRRPFDVDGEPIEVGLSVGAAVGGAGTDPDALITQADLAMYGEKQVGHHRRVPRPEVDSD